MCDMVIERVDNIEGEIEAVVENGVVCGDLECLNCGYNLRTLHVVQGCPECGMPIRVTMRKDRLKDASPAWLMALERGARLLKLGVILSFPLLYMGVVIGVIGFFHLMQKEGDREEPMKDRNIRYASQGLLGLSAMGFIALTLSVGWMLLYKRHDLFNQFHYFDSFFIVVHGIFVVGVLLAWRYVRVLAERIPDEHLIKGCKRIGWEWIGAIVGILVVAGFANLGNFLYTFFNHYNWLYAPVLLGLVALILIWMWWRTIRFCGMMIVSLGAQLQSRERTDESRLEG
ncbi:hypothetical protein JD969_04790 [Planctomycetota bacterium]|nr:hypothetical protein JD969_04790 [Planctomycetota bacterium]